MGRLKKSLKTVDIFSIASGAMISSGIFVLPAIAYAKVGSFVFISYLLASIFMIPSIFAKAELVTAMPKAGGTYYFVERGLGSFFGVIAGISAWFSLSLKSAFALIGIGIFAKFIFPDLTGYQIKLIAIFFCIIFTLLNLFSLKSSGRIQTILVMGLISILLLYIFKGFKFVDFSRFDFSKGGDVRKIISTAGLVFISYGGLTKVASVAEETHRPEKTIPKGMFLSFFIVSVIYIISVFVTVGVIGGEKLLSSLTPLSDGAAVFMGKIGSLLLSVGAMLAFITTANAGILAASRSPLAMSRDELLPGIFKKLSKRGLPYISILFTSGFMILVILLLNTEELAKTASLMKIILFFLVILSLIVMRKGEFLSYKPRFKAPLFPWMYILTLPLYAFLIFEMGTIPILITFFLFFIAIVWYLLYARRKTTRKSAIIHVLEDLTGIKTSPPTLEKELRKIVVEMDNLPDDKIFDAIHDGIFLDLPYSTDMEEFLTRVAIELRKKIKDLDFISLRKELYRVFRENEVFSGFLFSFLEIPYKDVFEIVGIRCRRGFKFLKEKDIIGIIMVLSSKENKEIAMCATAELLAIVKDEKFIYRWSMAKDTEELKSIIIFSEKRGRSCIVY